MLKKILLVLVLVSLVVVIGCKKDEPVQSDQTTMDSLQKQAGDAGDKAAKDADAAKKEAGKTMEDAGKQLQK